MMNPEIMIVNDERRCGGSGYERSEQCGLVVCVVVDGDDVGTAKSPEKCGLVANVCTAEDH